MKKLLVILGMSRGPYAVDHYISQINLKDKKAFWGQI